MSQKDAYIHKLKAKLDECSADIEMRKAKADRADTDARVEYQKKYDDMQTKRSQVGKNIEELRQAGVTAWEDLKAGADSTWESFRETAVSATSFQ